MNTYFIWNLFSSTKAYQNCEIVVIPQKLEFRPYGFGFQDESPYLPLFNHAILKMMEKGSLSKHVTDYIPPKQVCPDLTGTALGFNSTISAFGVFLIGAALGFGLFIIELIIKKTGLNLSIMEM